ncbi:MAG: tRNA (adenine(22)-N(1))-methyltransferase [Firmicutes bacterium]|nr:tRNA (adenine(22)-N(1))-methyltransferase [Bacillota bacterium]
MTLLSPRLAALLQMLAPCATLADIGSDHAMLISGAVQAGKAQRGIAVEINLAPFLESQRAVCRAGLQGKIEVRRGDGLAPLGVGEVDALCCAGMGGGTISQILAKGEGKLSAVRQMLLQPNVDGAKLRQHLLGTGFRVTDDQVVEDGAYTYQLIYAEPGKELKPYSPLELEYGRHNLARRSSLLVTLLARDILHWNKVRAELKRSNTEGSELRRRQIDEWIAQLEEVEKLGHC